MIHDENDAIEIRVIVTRKTRDKIVQAYEREKAKDPKLQFADVAGYFLDMEVAEA